MFDAPFKRHVCGSDLFKEVDAVVENGLLFTLAKTWACHVVLFVVFCIKTYGIY